MVVSFLVLVSTVLLAASAHLLLKVGVSQVGAIGADQVREPLKLVASLLSNPRVVVAMPLYGVSFVAWLVVLSRLNLSLAYPALAMTYAIIPLASWLLLDESISALHWVGIVVVVIGVVLILRGGLS